jgi:hypothetical protein
MEKQISKHIQSGIQIKKKNQGGGIKSKVSPMSLNYKLFLQKGGKKEKVKIKDKDKEKIVKIKRETKESSTNSSQSNNDSSIKIIKHKGKVRRSKLAHKTSKINKDINEIEKEMRERKINVSVKEKPKKEKPKLEEPKKEKPKKLSKASNRGTKDRSRKNKKSNKRKVSRNVSFKKHRRISEKDIDRVQKHIEEIRSKKTGDIKSELEKEGIKVSGKSKRLLKDIYLYSKLCGINIQHEK